MPVTYSVLDNQYDSVDGASKSSASISPAADKLYVVFLQGRGTSVTVPGSISGNGLTWTNINSVGGGGVTAISAWYAVGAGSSGSVSWTHGGTITGTSWVIVEFSDINTVTPIVQSATGTNTATSLTVSLGAFGSSSNATVGWFVHNTNETTNVGSGFTAIAQQSGGNPATSHLVEFNSGNDTSVDSSWTTSSICRGIAIEIAYQAPSSGLSSTILRSGGVIGI